MCEIPLVDDDKAVDSSREDVHNLEESSLICNLMKIKEEVQKLQEELQELKITKTIHKDEDPTLAISQRKEIELLAELKVLKQKKPFEIEVCYPLLIEVVKKHLNEQEESLKQTLEAIKNETVSLKDEEQRHEKIVKEENHLITILEKELAEQNSQSAQNGRTMENLQEKLLRAKRLRKKRMKEIRLFLKMYYPLPGRETLLKYMNKPTDETVELGVMSLGELLELLLNTTWNKPHDPWITLDDSMWPPYIELLLRYNIIVRHPENCTLIKLETD